AVVLSAGGLRGAAHVGVLRRLMKHGVPIDAIVGASAGAIVGAYFASVGLELDELASDAETFRGRHILAYSLNVHFDYRHEDRLTAWCGVIPERLRQLQSASFPRLHPGVQSLGSVCHDVAARRPRYFWTGLERGPALYDVVRASASIPWVFPEIAVSCNEE